MRRSDFERILATRSAARSPHFALHRADDEPGEGKLSTGDAPIVAEAVDNLLSVGFAVPKRHARRSVTRNLIRRQMRAAVQRHRAALRGFVGSKWVLRLRAPFDADVFPSASSRSLKSSVRRELEVLLGGLPVGSKR